MLGRRRQERREGRQAERDAFGRHGNASRYQIREKLLAIGDDSWIEDESGQKVFKVNGKALRVRKTMVFEDPDGNELCKIQERKLRVKDSMAIEGPDGERLALVKKAIVGPLRERWVADLAEGSELRVEGNIVDHEYEIEQNDVKIAEVSKRWFHVRETYGVEIAPGQHDIVVLAVAVAVDAMADQRG